MADSVLITQCLQNDFVKLIGKYDELPNALHVGYSESQRLLGEAVEEGPLQAVMHWAYALSADTLGLIHIRDWHDEHDAEQAAHLAMFGEHCLQNTEGASFVFESSVRAGRRHHIVNASGLNDFVDTNLAALLDQERPTRIGLMGVWTEAKVLFLAFELRTRYPHVEVAVCSALCASSSRQMHFISLEQMKTILGVHVFASVGDFTSFLAGSQPVFQSSKTTRLDAAKLHFVSPYNMRSADEKLVLYLFRDCLEVELRGLDGGFSGNVVLKARSRDLLGHQQVPCVVKIGPRELIAKERISFEKIQEVLGNNAPAIVEFAEAGDRGAIKYRYAAMLEGPVSCFQDLYEAGTADEELQLYLDRIFLHQLGRLYEAETYEKLNLMTYYDFRPTHARHVETSVKAILGPASKSPLEVEIVPGFTGADLVRFYAQQVPEIAAHSQQMHYVSYVHGDLNGRNILLDHQGNVWIIDFFNCERGHVLRDLVKLENDLLYIFTKIDGEAELEQARLLTDILLEQEDLGTPPDAAEQRRFAAAALKRAWRTVCRLRGYYPELVKLDRSPHQAHVAMLRYAAHTLSFDECSPFQKRWALYTAARCVQRILQTHSGTQRLSIDFLPDHAGRGKIGLTILPGRKDRDRSLDADLGDIRNAGITRVLCLVTPDELERYGVPDLLQAYAQAGIGTYELPILDQGAPTSAQMDQALAWMRTELANGENLLIHCVGGLGRSGLCAAAYLIRFENLPPDQAIGAVRRVRGQRAVETRLQEAFLRRMGSA